MFIEIGNILINVDEILSVEVDNKKNKFTVYMIKHAGQTDVFGSYWDFHTKHYPEFKSKLLQCGKEIY
jgi:hypothetical protein